MTGPIPGRRPRRQRLLAACLRPPAAAARRPAARLDDAPGRPLPAGVPRRSARRSRSSSSAARRSWPRRSRSSRSAASRRTASSSSPTSSCPPRRWASASSSATAGRRCPNRFATAADRRRACPASIPRSGSRSPARSSGRSRARSATAPRCSVSAGRPGRSPSYLVEGGGSRSFAVIKEMMARDPETLRAPAGSPGRRRGRGPLVPDRVAAPHAVQLFDTWAGELSAEDYREWALPAVARAIAGIRRNDRARDPLRQRLRPRCSRRWRASGADVLSVDWRCRSPRRADACPAARSRETSIRRLLGGTPDDVARARPARCSRETGGAAHVVNLGHGILPCSAARVRRGVLRGGPRRPARRRRAVTEVRAMKPADVPLELLRRYNVPGPRYTSYPDGPGLEGEYGPARLRPDPRGERLGAPARARSRSTSTCPSANASATSAAAPSSSRARGTDRSTPTSTRSSREIDWVAERAGRGRPVVQLHWGGGTPTYFSPELLERLGERIFGALLPRAGRRARRRDRSRA